MFEKAAFSSALFVFARNVIFLQEARQLGYEIRACGACLSIPSAIVLRAFFRSVRDVETAREGVGSMKKERVCEDRNGFERLCGDRG